MSEDGVGRAVVPIPALTDPERLRSLAETRLGSAPAEAFDRFARLVGDLLDVPVALVSLVTADRQFFPGATGLPEPWAGRRETPLSHSFCQHVVDVEVPMVLPDARLYPRVRRNLAIEDLGVVAYAGMPLTDLDGRVLGSLCAIDSKPRAWTAEQLRTLADLAAACSSELRLRIAVAGAEQARRRAEEAHDRLAMLAGMSELLGGTLDMATAVDRLGQAMVPLLADWCLITLVDPAGQPRTVSGLHRDPDRAADLDRFTELLTTGLGPDSIIRSVLRTGRPVMREAAAPADVEQGTTHPELAPLAERLGFGSPSGTSASMYSFILVRKAMTSWRVNSSISSTFAFSKLAWSRIHWASSLEIPILPSSAWASQARPSISCQMAYLFSREKMCPISGRV